ncbi:MAG: hypothetical protein CYPHOPRED_004202 [Cyphobasidiales sp. Tagirdzhanova-0007]|nr:MAG: hypothetical protein CYPHOPRED_004202 [Cyphobasidiales sp. Tagirdzhanova-0007]
MPVESGRSYDKGKQRAVVEADDEEVSLDLRRFIYAQIATLNTPFKDLSYEDYAQEDESCLSQKVLDKAVKALSKQMEMARKRKHTEHAIGLIVEQLEYLKTELANAKKGGVVDSEGRLRIDR